MTLEAVARTTSIDRASPEIGILASNACSPPSPSILLDLQALVFFSDNYFFTPATNCDNLNKRKDCGGGGGRNCSLIDGLLGFLPRFMSMNEIDCTGQRLVRVAFVALNVSDVRNGVRQPLDPGRTLVAEGAWNEEKTMIDFVVCRIVNFTEDPLNASIGDCSIRVNFELPDRLSFRNWSVVSDHMWSDKGVDEPGYFDRIGIHASGTRRAALPDMKYEYTETGRAGKFCAEKKGIKHKGKIFPDPVS